MEKGIVTSLQGEKLTVSFNRSPACAGCKACAEGKKENEMVIEAYNDCNAKLGDTVEVSIEDSFVLKATFIMYVIPLITMFIGFLIGNLHSQLTSFITGIVFLAITYSVIRMNEHRFQNRNFTAKAVKIVEQV